MIVILSTTNCNHFVVSGDTFRLTHDAEFFSIDNACKYDNNNREILVEEKFNKNRSVTCAISFMFADADGRVSSPNICGFFGQKINLPDELKNAKHLHQLTFAQRHRLMKSAGIKLK